MLIQMRKLASSTVPRHLQRTQSPQPATIDTIAARSLPPHCTMQRVSHHHCLMIIWPLSCILQFHWSCETCGWDIEGVRYAKHNNQKIRWWLSDEYVERMKFSRGFDGDNRLSISVDCWLYGWVRGTRMWIYVEVMVMIDDDSCGRFRMC